MTRDLRCSLVAATAALAISLAGCADSGSQSAEAPIQVATVAAESIALQLSEELPGRVVALRTAEIRPQVGGIIQRRLFAEGTVVSAGQPLFQINPAAYRAEVASASASLQRAVAVKNAAGLLAGRYRSLITSGAISRQNMDEAEAALAQAEADVASAQAALDRRRLDLGFATVTAPIGGRVGAANVTEGALADVVATAPLAIIQQIDAVFVDVKQPAATLERLRASSNAALDIDILDAGGKPTGKIGQLVFSELRVDPGTGELTVRIRVENRDHKLLPGMFVRARLPRQGAANNLVVPQQAVLRRGDATSVLVVGADGKAVSRQVEIGDAADGRYVVRSGLKPGERVIVEGQDRVEPGAVVVARPWRRAALQTNLA